MSSYVKRVGDLTEPVELSALALRKAKKAAEKEQDDD